MPIKLARRGMNPSLGLERHRICKGWFDCVVAALREPAISLRMTFPKQERRLFEKNYSYRNASIGLRRAALIAGNMPLMMPTKLRIAVDQIRDRKSTRLNSSHP